MCVSFRYDENDWKLCIVKHCQVFFVYNKNFEHELGVWPRNKKKKIGASQDWSLYIASRHWNFFIMCKDTKFKGVW